MDNAAEKVIPLKPERDAPDASQAQVEELAEDLAGDADQHAGLAPAPHKTQSDMGRMALVISLLLGLILLVSYFFLARDIKAVSAEVQALNALKTQVADMDGKMGRVELRMAALESLPAQTKRIVVRSMIQEMASKAAFLAKDVEAETDVAKLNEAIGLLKQVEQGMAPK